MQTHAGAPAGGDNDRAHYRRLEKCTKPDVLEPTLGYQRGIPPSHFPGSPRRQGTAFGAAHLDSVALLRFSSSDSTNPLHHARMRLPPSADVETSHATVPAELLVDRQVDTFRPRYSVLDLDERHVMFAAKCRCLLSQPKCNAIFSNAVRPSLNRYHTTYGGEILDRGASEEPEQPGTTSAQNSALPGPPGPRNQLSECYPSLCPLHSVFCRALTGTPGSCTLLRDPGHGS